MSFTQEQLRINHDIKEKTFAGIYLLCGSQSYLRMQNRDRLIAAALGEDEGASAMNLSRFSGKDVDVREIGALARTLPFFADRRVIVVEQAGLFEKGETGDLLAQELDGIPETACVIISEEKADRRKRLYKLIEKTGAVLDTDEIEEAQLVKWTAKLFADAGAQISAADLELFLHYVGQDMLQIKAEADKLIAFHAQDESARITGEDIRSLCTPRPEDRIFDMISAVAAKDAKTAMSVYMVLCALRTPPQVILSLLGRQFSQLLQLREMDGRYPDRELAAMLSVPPFVLTKRLRPCLKGYSSRSLKRIVDGCLKADEEYKSGLIDPQIAVEQLIIGAMTEQETENR